MVALVMDVTCTSSYFHTYHDEGDSVTVLGYKTSADLAQSTSYIPLLTENTSADNDEVIQEHYIFLVQVTQHS
jgi:predicted proteasome-type protease